MIRRDRSQTHRVDVNQTFKQTKISLFKYRLDESRPELLDKSRLELGTGEDLGLADFFTFATLT